MRVKKNKSFIFLLIIITIFSVGVGLKTKSSFIDNSSVFEQIKNGNNIILKDTSSEEFINAYFNNNVQSMNELYKLSDLVLVVKLTGERVNCAQSILSEVEVIKNLKDSNLDIDRNIKIYEPNNFMYDEFYYSLGGYNIMQYEKEYIVFLETLRTPEGYNEKSSELVFKPVSTMYGKFDIFEKNETKIILEDDLENENLTYSDIKDNEVLFTTEKDVKFYNLLKKDVLKLYSEN